MKKQKGKIECKAEINETIPQPLAKEEKQKKKKKQINKRAEKFFKLLQNKRKQKQTLNEIEEEIRILTNNPNSTKIDKETIKKEKKRIALSKIQNKNYWGANQQQIWRPYEISKKSVNMRTFFIIEKNYQISKITIIVYF